MEHAYWLFVCFYKYSKTDRRVSIKDSPEKISKNLSAGAINQNVQEMKEEARGVHASTSAVIIAITNTQTHTTSMNNNVAFMQPM